MIYNQVYSTLSQILKTCPFGKDHAKQGVDIFYTAFLTAPHWIAIISSAKLNLLDSGFKSIWIAKYRTSVGEQMFKQREEFICSNPLFKMIKNKADSSFCAAVQQEESFLVWA